MIENTCFHPALKYFNRLAGKKSWFLKIDVQNEWKHISFSKDYQQISGCILSGESAGSAESI
jgi:hypothetical protein